MSQTDHIDTSYESSHSITAEASAVFFKVFFVGGLYATMHSDVDSSSYLTSRKHSEFSTYGGPPFQQNYTLWEQSIPDALTAIDRHGEPLHFSITPCILNT